MRRLLLILLLIVLGCTSTQYNLIPIAYKQKAKRFNSKDKNGIICEGREADLVLFGYRDKSEIYIYFCIINKTDNKNLDIIPDKIKAFGLTNTRDVKQLIIYSIKECLNKKRNQAEQAQFSLALCNAIDFMNAIITRRYSQRYSNVSENLGGSIFTKNEYRNDIVTSYSYNKDRKSLFSTTAEIPSKSDAENQLYNSILLKKNIIPPNSYLEGLLIIDGKEYNPEKYVIIFPIGIDNYKIILNSAMVKK